jgi:hypothetical protein
MAFGAPAELPEPSVSVKPGAELDSISERSVNGFNASANTATDGRIDAVTTASIATSGVPRRTIDLSVYMFVYLLFCFYISSLNEGFMANNTITDMNSAMTYPQHFIIL